MGKDSFGAKIEDEEIEMFRVILSRCPSCSVNERESLNDDGVCARCAELVNAVMSQLRKTFDFDHSKQANIAIAKTILGVVQEQGSRVHFLPKHEGFEQDMVFIVLGNDDHCQLAQATQFVNWDEIPKGYYQIWHYDGSLELDLIPD